MTVRCLECGDEIPLFGDRECSCSATRVEREEQELFEQLAALEHRQWVHWTQNLAEREDLPDHLIERWEANWCPYDELDEETKKHDRRWAAEVVEIIEGENSIQPLQAVTERQRRSISSPVTTVAYSSHTRTSG